MAETAKALGKGGFIEFEGKKYELTPLTPDMLGMFEVWLEERAHQSVERMRHKLSPEQYRMRVEIVTEQCAAGRYAWAGEVAQKAAESLPGRKYTTWLMLQPKNPELDFDTFDRMFTERMVELTAKVQEANYDPLRGGPAGEVPTPAETTFPSPSSAPSSATSPGA